MQQIAHNTTSAQNVATIALETDLYFVFTRSNPRQKCGDYKYVRRRFNNKKVVGKRLSAVGYQLDILPGKGRNERWIPES
jgi:hypothetical protein